jgi:hypothetical protein
MIYNFTLSTNYVVTSKNINEIPLFIKNIKKYNFVSKNIFAFVRPIKSYKKNYKNYLPSFINIKNIFDNLEYSNKILIQYLPYCVLKKSLQKQYLDFFAK